MEFNLAANLESHTSPIGVGLVTRSDVVTTFKTICWDNYIQLPSICTTVTPTTSSSALFKGGPPGGPWNRVIDSAIGDWSSRLFMRRHFKMTALNSSDCRFFGPDHSKTFQPRSSVFIHPLASKYLKFSFVEVHRLSMPQGYNLQVNRAQIIRAAALLNIFF